MDCGAKERFNIQDTSEQDTTKDEVRPVRGQRPRLDVTLRASDVKKIVDTFQKVIHIKVNELEGNDVMIPADRLMDTLAMTIGQAAMWRTSSLTASTRTQQPPSSGEMPNAPQDAGDCLRRLEQRGRQVRCEAGKHKGHPMMVAYNDAGYRKCVLENIDSCSHRHMIAIKQLFQDYDRARDEFGRGGRSSYMALQDAPVARENDLIAILDTGCNQTCHGDRWLRCFLAATLQDEPTLKIDSGTSCRGIGGTVSTSGIRNLELCLELLDSGVARWNLRSVELAESDAPLLISLQAQRALGLIINLNAEVVHSQALGQSLKLVIKDGLFGLRLLPGDAAEEEDLEEDIEEKSTNEPNGVQYQVVNSSLSVINEVKDNEHENHDTDNGQDGDGEPTSPRPRESLASPSTRHHAALPTRLKMDVLKLEYATWPARTSTYGTSSRAEEVDATPCYLPVVGPSSWRSSQEPPSCPISRPMSTACRLADQQSRRHTSLARH